MPHINIDRPAAAVAIMDALREAIYEGNLKRAEEQARALREELWEVESHGRAALEVEAQR